MRADTRTRELSGDLLRLQRAYDRVSQELSTHRWVVLGGGQGAAWVGLVGLVVDAACSACPLGAPHTQEKRRGAGWAEKGGEG